MEHLKTPVAVRPSPRKWAPPMATPLLLWRQDAEPINWTASCVVHTALAM